MASELIPGTNQWHQGQLVEISITDLSDSGDGVGRFHDRVVFVPDTVPGDRVLVRLLRIKSSHAIGKVHQILEASLHRIRPHCIVADKCGGCQWQHIDYNYQLQAKQTIVIQALERIGNITQPSVEPVLADPNRFGYRNKSTYPFGRSGTGHVQAGYYQKGSHQLINLNQCPVQDIRLNPLLAEVKQDIEQRQWSIYAENQHRGELRHLSLRIGRYTGEILLTLIVKQGNLPGIETQAQTWLNRYPNLVGVCLNYNPAQSNVIFGEKTKCIIGQAYLREKFAGLEFQLRPDTFFQINPDSAQRLLQEIGQELNLQGQEIVLDAYCGIGTFSLPLAQQVAQVIGLELQAVAVAQAQLNAQINGINNATFQVGAVENLLLSLTITPDIVLLDPPRKGCDRVVLETLLQIQPQRIVYISCNPATLARDLQILCQSNIYRLTRVQPADFFPQTSHIECAAFLVKQN